MLRPAGYSDGHPQLVKETTINGKVINRHTGAEDARLWIHSQYLHEMDTMARSVTFHQDLLQLAEVEAVPYWQSIKSPTAVSLGSTVSLTDYDGSVLTTEAGNGTLPAVFGVIHDKDAAGYAFVNRFDWATPGINAAGGYVNMFHHANVRTIQDTTEKSLLLLMD